MYDSSDSDDDSLRMDEDDRLMMANLDDENNAGSYMGLSPLHRRGVTNQEALQRVIQCRIWEAARDGILITLNTLLCSVNKKQAKYFINELVTDGEQKSTPLIIAAKRGHDSVVELLLKRYQPDVEIEGCVQFDGYLIEGATALWCAAGLGHLNVVKALVEYGADVNHATKSQSTPLRAACFDGRLDILQYLVEHGADVNISNKFNNTCLMIAAYKGHLSIVEYLLSLKCNPDAKAHCGASAIHFAAENGHLSVIKALLEAGAQLTKNVIGMTPLMAAAERNKAHIVEYFIGSNMCSDIERIEALELLGASYANNREDYNLSKAYYFMMWGMTLRYANRERPHLKRVLSPIAAYEYRKECETIDELEAIKDDANALHMEALMIRERILGPNNPELPLPVIFRGAVYADHAQFDRCLQLWIHALRMRRVNHVSIKKDLLRFAQVFSQMLHLGEHIDFEIMLEVFDTAVDELRRNKYALEKFKQFKTEDVVRSPEQEELDDNMLTALYLLCIISKVIQNLTAEDEEKFLRIVYQLARLNLQNSKGSSLLHLAASADTPIDDFHTKNVCKFPCAASARYLIRCGADVNVMDHDRNTPLHVIVGYQKPISDFLTLHTIISHLVNSGAHLDCVNMRGQTPLKAATTGVAEIILRNQPGTFSLKCMSATVVKSAHIPYQGLVPKSLAQFIDLHGVPDP